MNASTSIATRREQLSVLWRQTPTASIAGVSIAGFMCLFLATRVDRERLGLWFGGVVLVAALRWQLALVASRHVHRTESPVPWLVAFTIAAFCTGAVWGWAAMWYLIPEEPLLLSLCVLGIGGLTSGALGSLSAHLPAYLAFALASQLPIVFMSLGERTLLGYAIASMSATYLVANVLFARIANRTLLESIRLRFTNEELVQSLTEQKERALAEQRRAEQATLAKSKFLAAASHDLRQPVHALGLFVGTLRERASADVPLTYLAGRIDASTQALKQLLDALLDVSRLDAGSIAPTIAPTPLLPLFRRVADELGEVAAHKGVELRIADTTGWVSTDGAMLERIVRNLVHNAVQYTPEGGVILLGAHRRGDELRVSVWDTGIGIPRESFEEIFEEFRQLHNSERDRSQGLGLGLAIVRRLAKLLALDVSIHSVVGRGSRFDIRLPRTTPAAIADDPGSVAPSPQLVGVRVLVIDDEALVRDALTSALEMWHCVVRVAGSTEEALARVADFVPDVIVADYRLRNDETGYHAVSAVRAALGTEVPALVTTGDTAAERLRETRATGLPLLHKPIALEVLQRMLSSLLPNAEPSPAERPLP